MTPFPDAVAMTRDLVAIPSVNPALEPDGAAEGAVAQWCADRLAEWGWTPAVREVAPGRWNVHAVRGEGGPALLLNGHLDTVGTAGMTVDPFGADSDADRIRGRGACDMKSGVAAVLDVARRAAEEDWPGTLHVLLVADEEHASVGMQAALRELDTAGIDFAVVTEPTSLAVMPAHKGFAWVRATFDGVAAHGSRPEVGVDAVRMAARFVTALDTLDADLSARAPHPLLGHGSWHVGTIHGGSAPSVYPDRCEVVFERRTVPGEDEAGFEDELRRVADAVAATRGVGSGPDLRVRFASELLRPSSDVSPDHPAVRALLDAAVAEGLEPRIEGMTAWVDAALLVQAGVPAVCFGPGSIGKAHTADEYVPVDEIVAAASVLARFTRRFLSGEFPGTDASSTDPSTPTP